MRLAARCVTVTLDEMRILLARGRVPVLGLLVTVFAACHGAPQGPSVSSVVLHNVSLKSTTGNTALCCCHVTGTAENDNPIPVHLTIEVSAFDSHNNSLATILGFVPDLQPGATTPFEAAGFVFPCNSIVNIRTQVNVSGVAYPPL
ncbi:MAG TPA: FxLYD domain-containing protein [Vicinamibacterales bacterium]|nr:FxLYD domain-containing protein [Vicinamibacterales bacterium]